MAGNQGTIILKADSSGVRRGTDDLRRLDKQATKSERVAARLGTAFGRMAKYGAVAAAGLAGLFARSVIRNTVEQDKAVAQLNASLKSTGRYTDEASAALQAHAAALQQVSTFGDEAIITAQSQLLTFKSLGDDVLPRTTEAVLDLSTKMGQGLKESAVQLGKALNDPVANLGALGRVGIQFSEDQKKLIKDFAETNQLAKAQAIILEELESEFGGAARAARNTLGGALDAVKNNFGDLLEVSGDNSKGVVKSLNDLADTLARPETKEGFQTLATGALSFLESLAQLPGVVGFLKDELLALFGVIDTADYARVVDELGDVDAQLELLYASRKKLAGGFGSGGLDAQIAELEAERDRLLANIKALEAQTVLDNKNPPPPPVNIPPAGGTSSSNTDDEDAAKKAAEAELKRLADRKQATDSLRESIRDFAAEQGGPVVEAQQRYEDALAEIDETERKLLETGGLTKQQESDLQELREAALVTKQQTIDLINEETEALANQITPAQQVLADLELELELQGLSNIERQKKLALIYAETDATTENGQAIVDAIDRIAANDDAIQAMDTFRRSAANALAGFADGAVSAKDAFKDFMSSMRTRLLQLIAENLIEKAFGGFGSTGGGAAGGGIASFFGSLFGKGAAVGGFVGDGKIHPVNELGVPELLSVGNKQYLMPTNQNANVIPLDRTKSGRPQTTNITVNLPPATQRRSAQQIANEVALVQKRASSRNA